MIHLHSNHPSRNGHTHTRTPALRLERLLAGNTNISGNTAQHSLNVFGGVLRVYVGGRGVRATVPPRSTEEEEEQHVAPLQHHQQHSLGGGGGGGGGGGLDPLSL